MQSLDDLVRNYAPKSRRRRSARPQAPEYPHAGAVENPNDQFPSTIGPGPFGAAPPVGQYNSPGYMNAVPVGFPGTAGGYGGYVQWQVPQDDGLGSRVATLEEENASLKQQISLYEQKIQRLERHLDVFFYKLKRFEEQDEDA